MRPLLSLRSEELPAGLRMPLNKHKAESSFVREHATPGRYQRVTTNGGEQQRTAAHFIDTMARWGVLTKPKSLNKKKFWAIAVPRPIPVANPRCHLPTFLLVSLTS